MNRTRRSLTGWRGGKVTVEGEAAVGQLLEEALGSLGGERQREEWTHGFHSYPARFPPQLVRRLLAGTPGHAVLDPFVGSGTTLIEAAAAGRAGWGSDINPLAVELSRLKATVWPPERRAALCRAATEVAQRVLDEVRVARRASSPKLRPSPATRYDDPRHYPPHVFRELVALRQAIDALAEEWTRWALRLVLSAIVVKASAIGATAEGKPVERQIARGAPSRWFAAKALELGEQMNQYARQVPRGTPGPRIELCDARRLGYVADATIDLAITSPPYLGTYDYAQHHVHRFGWVGLDAQPLLRGQIGTRNAATPQQWGHDVRAFVGELARVLRPGGWIYFLVGDSAIGQRAFRGDVELRRAAGTARLPVVAIASQIRPDVFAPTRGRLADGRREYLVAVQKR